MKASVMSNETSDQNSVIAVSFAQDEDAYAALTKLKELDDQSQVELRAAAIVVRHADGNLTIKDEVADTSAVGAAGGGILGLLIGVLFGPFGVLIGGVTGLLVGSLFDGEDDDETESVLSDIARQARVDHPSLLAEVGEPSSDVIDAAMAEIGADVLRRPVVDVEAEIAAAEAAQKAARKQARKVLREHRRATHRDEIRAKIASLKAKLPHRARAEAGAHS
jgi:uncharacterized membrane protein